MTTCFTKSLKFPKGFCSSLRLSSVTVIEIRPDRLIERAQRGDSKALEKFVIHYYPAILNFCFRLLRNRSDAEDVTQDVFVKVGKRLTSLKNISAHRAWLYKIASSTANDLLRKRGRRGEQERPLHLEEEPRDLKKDMHSDTLEIVARLPEPLKQSIILVYWEGLNHAEVGAILDCAESTVSWRIHEAKKRLKNMMEAHV